MLGPRAVETAPLLPCVTSKQLLIDISVLVRCDARTGIQRVVRSILWQWLTVGVDGHRVEPIYAVGDGTGYRYARSFCRRFLGKPDLGVADEPMDCAPGDVFVALDLVHQVLLTEQHTHQAMRQQGVRVFSLVYDLLPIKLPHAFPSDIEPLHANWLDAVAQLDGAICISRAVADDLFDWCESSASARTGTFEIHWFHLGSDCESLAPRFEYRKSADLVIQAVESMTSVLMVGTLEPRKQYHQALAAFEHMWEAGHEILLVIVGSPGWLAEGVIASVSNHPERNRRLFWLEGADDGLLAKLYRSSSVLLAASIDEGFGLPIVEAARASLPVLARDLPVFREVGGSSISYFSGESPVALADAILNWLNLKCLGALPDVSGLKLLSWQESSARLVIAVTGAVPYKVWAAKSILRLAGSSGRLRSQVGRCVGSELLGSGPGYLVYGPYIALEAGSYLARIKGSPGTADPTLAIADVTVNGGATSLATLPGGRWQLDGNWLLTLPFDLAVACIDLEVRVWVPFGSTIRVSNIEILVRKPLEELASGLETTQL